MQKSCTRQPWQLFFSSKQGGEGGGGGGGGEEEEEEKRRRRRRRRRRRMSELQCSLPQQCSRVVLVGQGSCFFPVNKVEKGEKEEEVDILSSKQGVEDGGLEGGGG